MGEYDNKGKGVRKKIPGGSFVGSAKALYLCKIEGKDMSEGRRLIVTINNHPVFGPVQQLTDEEWRELI